MADITVIGSFVMDMTSYVEDFVKDGETIMVEHFGKACGGKGVNQAVAVKRLGHDAEMIGMVGNDDFGREFLAMLGEEGVEHSHVFVNKTLPTGMAHIQVDKHCQNRITVIPGANSGFGFEELEKIDSCIKNTKILLVQFELNVEVTREILKRAVQYGVTTVLNPAPARCTDFSLLCLADYLTPNAVELATISGMPTDTVEQALAAAEYVHSRGVKNVICTLGGNGALIVNDALKKIVPIFSVPVVDTVAAGDSFNAALAVKLLEEADISDAVLFANAEGALTVTKTGAIPALHTREVVEAFIEERKKANEVIYI